VISYYGYIKPGSKPDDEREGKKYCFLYVWIPAVTPEIRIRMISPVPDKMAPAEGDFASEAFKANAEE